MDESQLIKALDRDDSYRTIRVLGDGPSGRTELVRGLKAELLVRKRIPKELANERSWTTIRSMSHPLLPQVRDLYWLPDELVVILTYIDGITLGEMVHSTGPLSVSEAINYLDDLCVGVGALHARGIVHRDLSPNNVVVSGGSARIIDLGNARVFVEGAQHDTTRLGTWGYAAPEQFGFAQTDARSDVYGLGSLLGFLLTGVDPGDETFAKALADEARVPFVLRLVVERARAFEPSARFQTAADLMAAIRAAVPEYTTIRAIPLDEMRAAPSVPAGKSADTTSRKTVIPIESTWSPPDSSARERTEGTPHKRTESSPRVGYRIPWRDAGLPRQLAIIANWMFFLFWAACFLAVGLDPNAKEGEWTPLTYLFIGVVEAPICAMIGYEIHQALLHRGRYDIGKGRIFVLLKRMVLLLALAFAALFICYLVGYVLNFVGISNLPGRGI